MQDIVRKIFLITIVAFLVFAIVLYKMDPDKAGGFGFVVFYLSMFATLFGLFFLIGFYGRKVLRLKDDFAFRNSLWQGGLLSLAVLAGVLLEYFDYLNISTAIVLFLAIIFLEPMFYKKVA